MYDNIERELKVLLTKEIYQDILNSYDFHSPIIQTNTYYDTENGILKKQHGAMRIREIGDIKIFTLKIKKDEYTHYEFEKQIDTDHIQKIRDPQIKEWLQQYQIPENVYPIATFTTKRRIYEFENGELCLDETKFKNHKDYEIEYEYTKEHDGISFFNELLKKYNLKWEKNCPSKIARAMKD